MPQASQTKNYYTFVEGLNSEVSPLTYPEGTVVDTVNFELQIDGSLKRRKGLTPETEAAYNETLDADHVVNQLNANSTHLWRNAGGAADVHFHLVQVGQYVYIFTDDTDTMAIRDESLFLPAFRVPNSPYSDTLTGAQTIDVSYGRGQALITHPYCDPILLKYNNSADEITVSRVKLRIRDMRLLDELETNTSRPAALSAAHNYNLLNAGWRAADIATYYSDNSLYPARNMRYYRGYTRAETSGNTYDADGVRSYSSTKIDSELFGDAPAPRGRFIVDPFQSQYTPSDTVAISTWTDDTGTGTTRTFTVTTSSAHGLSAGHAYIQNQKSIYNSDWDSTNPVEVDWDFNGPILIATIPSTTTFTISVDFDIGFDSWESRLESKGVVSQAIDSGFSLPIYERPAVNSFFAGRAWYAGTDRHPVSNVVYFSQVILHDTQYGRCFQENDPTSEDLPDLLESDGGTIVIAELGTVKKLMPLGQSMLVFADNGVWEIDGGNNRYFDAIDYSIRKVTDVGCSSGHSVIKAENQIVYASQEGAYRIFVDPEARVLVANSITAAKVNRRWAEIPEASKNNMRSLYDPVGKKIWWLYDYSSVNSWSYTRALIYDVRLDSFYLYTLPGTLGVSTYTVPIGITKPVEYTRDGECVVKIVALDKDTSSVVWCEFSDEDFEDFGTDAAAYFITGYDHMGDASKDKQVRQMTTFMKRIQDSSLTMQGRWDFAESDITGRFSPSIECYRPPRLFIGDSEGAGDDGYPVVFTKHNLPGQGLVLSLKFSTSAGKDAHIYGWSIDFQGIQS